jgi:hypothetical protein
MKEGPAVASNPSMDMDPESTRGDGDLSGILDGLLAEYIVRVPEQAGHQFRRKAAIDSD